MKVWKIFGFLTVLLTTAMTGYVIDKTINKDSSCDYNRCCGPMEKAKVQLEMFGDGEVLMINRTFYTDETLASIKEFKVNHFNDKKLIVSFISNCYSSEIGDYKEEVYGEIGKQENDLFLTRTIIPKDEKLDIQIRKYNF